MSPYHRVERQTRPYRVGHHLGWYCVVCEQWWTREPRSVCPGLRVYPGWDSAQAAGLRTQTQWKALRRRLRATAAPAGVVMRGPAHPNDWFWLYDEQQTQPMRALPPLHATVVTDAEEAADA